MSTIENTDLRELLAKATPGEWRHRVMSQGQRQYPEVWAPSGFVASFGKEGDGDALLIAALRNAAPSLLDEIEHLRAKLEEARDRAREIFDAKDSEGGPFAPVWVRAALRPIAFGLESSR